jgi:TonB family protein
VCTRSITTERRRNTPLREQEIEGIEHELRLSTFSRNGPLQYSRSMLKPRYILLIISIICALASSVAAQTNARSLRVAVLDFGQTQTGQRAAEKLATALSSNNVLLIVDREESRAAARGAGYAGSLNMTLEEARALGGAIGCDFFIAGDAQTLRRSPSTGPFHEAYASIFIVSARTGRLILWDRPSFESSLPDEALKTLLKELDQRAARYAATIQAAQEAERNERAQASARALNAVATVIEDAPDDEAAAARVGLRLPQPYRRLRPAYPETAARAEAEATVDVQLEIDSDGEVARVEVVRWAGFGLDEAALSTVRQLHFRPAMRDGAGVPVRVLLRYNFRRPAK